MKLIDLSERLDHKIVIIYSFIAQAAKELNTDFLVVGATARDLMLHEAQGVKPLRMTIDIDIGVRMKNWDVYESLKNKLIKTGRFVSKRDVQRLEYKPSNGDRPTPIDIVPFGEISEPDSILDWQTGGEIQMDVRGFEQAYNNSVSIILQHEPRLDIKVASLPSQFVLKLLAWEGRRAGKDATDIFILITYYGDPVSRERLYEQELEIMEQENYDMDYAGAYLLGKDVGQIVTVELKSRLCEILDKEISGTDKHGLITAMPTSLIEDDFEKKLSLLVRVRAGLE